MNKLFTRPWIGILLIFLLLIYGEFLFFKYGFQNGFTVAAIYYQVFLAIVIACLIVSPWILEKSFISTKTGMYILILFILSTALGSILDVGGNWEGRCIFIALFMAFFYFLYWLYFYLEKYEHKTKGQNDFSNFPKQSQVIDESRRISSEVRKAVWERDGGKCKKMWFPKGAKVRSYCAGK
jgi:Ca2+/Na+ antiporter